MKNAPSETEASLSNNELGADGEPTDEMFPKEAFCMFVVTVGRVFQVCQSTPRNVRPPSLKRRHLRFPNRDLRSSFAPLERNIGEARLDCLRIIKHSSCY